MKDITLETLTWYDDKYKSNPSNKVIENDHLIRWKVEDSYGSKTHQEGYYIMNDNFFEDFVLEVIIDKKYLSQEQLKMLKQEPILFDMDEPF